MWYKIFDFNIFEEKSYPYQLLKGGWSLPFINVKWQANNGDFVKKGECIMTCEVNNSYYRQNPRNGDITIYDKKMFFYAPSEGFLYVKDNRKNDFECKKSIEICSIHETKSEYEVYANIFENSIFKKDYSCYIKVGTPYRLIDGEKITDYDISTSHKSTFIKVYLHPSIKETDELAIKITSWLCITNEIDVFSFGMNKNGMNSFIYINEDYSIDVIADSITLRLSLPHYITFREVSGDFKMYRYKTDSDNEITLKGCPNIVHGDFECSKCGLTKFENVPTYVGGDFIAKTNSISSFVGMPKYIGGCFNIANNEFDDAAWEYAKENIDGEFCDYNIANNKFVKYRKELY